MIGVPAHAVPRHKFQRHHVTGDVFEGLELREIETTSVGRRLASPPARSLACVSIASRSKAQSAFNQLIESASALFASESTSHMKDGSMYQHLTLCPRPARHRFSRAWFEPMQRYWRKIAWSRATLEHHLSFATSGLIHGVLLMLLALIVPTERETNGLQLLVVSDREVAPQPEVAEVVTLDAPDLEPFEELPPIAAEHFPQSPTFEDSDAIVPADLALVDVPMGGLDLLDITTLALDVDKLTTKRELAPRKEAKGLVDKQLADLAVPKNAKQAGAFTIFAEPANPVPDNPYWLIVQLDLPAEKSGAKVDASDISGQIAGTDGFRMTIPGGARLLLQINNATIPIAKPPMLHDRFGFEKASGRARWAIWVPAAGGGVRDAVRVQSKLLKQQQTLALEF